MDYPLIDWPEDEQDFPPATWLFFRTGTTSTPLDELDPPPQPYTGGELPSGATLHFRTRVTSRPRRA
jgi:hypothetical protein